MLQWTSTLESGGAMGAVALRSLVASQRGAIRATAVLDWIMDRDSGKPANGGPS